MQLKNRKLIIDGTEDNGTYTFTGVDAASGKSTTLTFTLNLPETFKFVDLGLPSGLLWANMNIGAESPTTLGDYYAYGETYHKTAYGMRNYPNVPLNKWVGAGGGTPTITTQDVFYTNYDGTEADTIDVIGLDCTDVYPKYTDNVSAVTAMINSTNDLTSNYDVAHKLYGKAYIPRGSEMTELVANTTQTIDAENGIVTFTGSNGKSIRVPMGGVFNGPHQIYGINNALSIPSGYAGAVKEASADGLSLLLGTATCRTQSTQYYCLGYNLNNGTLQASSYGCSGGLQLRAVKKP